MNTTRLLKIRAKSILIMVTIALALSFLSGAGTPKAEAATVAELQAQIQNLIAQINQLQLTLAQRTTTGQGQVCSVSLTRNLSLGMSGEDVRALQRFLNRDLSTRVAAVGIGSAGNESTYFGPLTQQAVIRFQEKYRSDVLTPRGLSVGTGIVDLSTRTKIHALCGALNIGSATQVTPTTPTPTPKPTPSGDEAILSRFKVSSGDDTRLEEGQRNASVMEARFDVRDADISINRVDVAFDHQLGDEDRPWRTFSEIALYVDGKKVASKSTLNHSDWDEDKPYNDAYQFRFSGLDIDVLEGERAEFTVALTLRNSIDGARDGLSWNIFIPNDGIRVRDEAGIIQTIGSNAAIVNIDIDEEGAEDELLVKRSSDDPNSTTLQVRSDRASDWLTVFAFDLDSDNSQNDIEVRELPVSLTANDKTVGYFMHDVRLSVNGDVYNDVKITNGMTNTMAFDFDRNEFVIDAGDRVTVEVQVRFKALDSSDEGVTIYGHINANDIEAEGADDLDENQLSGAATGDTHTLRTEGVVLNPVDTRTSRLGRNDTNGEFKIEFEATAFEGDFYIAPYVTDSTSTSSGGVKYSIDSTVPFAGTVSGALSSTAHETSGGIFVVREGRTETFTLTIVANPDQNGLYRVAMNKLYFTSNPDGVSDLITYVNAPISDYRTEYIYLSGE